MISKTFESNSFRCGTVFQGFILEARIHTERCNKIERPAEAQVRFWTFSDIFWTREYPATLSMNLQNAADPPENFC